MNMKNIRSVNNLPHKQAANFHHSEDKLKKKFIKDNKQNLKWIRKFGADTENKNSLTKHSFPQFQ